MRSFPLRRLFVASFSLFIICACISLGAGLAFGQAQANAADLGGYVRDPRGAVVAGATVTARNAAKSIERSATTNAT